MLKHNENNFPGAQLKRPFEDVSDSFRACYKPDSSCLHYYKKNNSINQSKLHSFKTQQYGKCCPHWAQHIYTAS